MMVELFMDLRRFFEDERKWVVECRKHFLYSLHHAQVCFVSTIDHRYSHRFVHVQTIVSKYRFQ